MNPKKFLKQYKQYTFNFQRSNNLALIGDSNSIQIQGEKENGKLVNSFLQTMFMFANIATKGLKFRQFLNLFVCQHRLVKQFSFFCQNVRFFDFPFLLLETSSSVRPCLWIKKKTLRKIQVKKISKLIYFLNPWRVSSNNFCQFGSAIWPAMVNNYNLYEGRALPRLHIAISYYHRFPALGLKSWF